MYKWSLVILAVIGTWYGLPLIWTGVSNIVWHRLTIGDFPLRWVHFFTIWIIVCAFKIKGK